VTAASRDYAGSELALFEHARHWKAYWASRVRPWLGRRVIEVGAGLGANVPFLWNDAAAWLCVEPDAALAGELRARVAGGRLPAPCEVVHGTLADVPAGRRADTVLYIDVLEHIADAQQEFTRAAARLDPGGHLVVLCPAHQSLYTEFDRAIGHVKRYARRDYEALRDPRLQLVRVEYLDSVGTLASLANRLLLRSAAPTPAQIRLWDGVMVPASRLLDPLLLRRVGKTIVGVWRALG
jgi:SAM-dependent methyltransferase